MARDKERYQEICSRIYKVPTEQSTIPEEDWRALSIGNTRRTMVRNQYQYYWTITIIKRKRCYCGLIHKNNTTKSNDNSSIITGNYKNLSR